MEIEQIMREHEVDLMTAEAARLLKPEDRITWFAQLRLINNRAPRIPYGGLK